MKSGNKHFVDAKHKMDKSMTPKMQEQMTRQYMKKSEKTEKDA